MVLQRLIPSKNRSRLQGFNAKLPNQDWRYRKNASLWYVPAQDVRPPEVHVGGEAEEYKFVSAT